MTTPKSWEQMSPDQKEQTYDTWFASELPDARREHTPEGFPYSDDIEDSAQDGLASTWATMLDESKFEIAKKLGVFTRPMNFARDTSRNAEVVSVPCLVCGRMLRLADAWIDTDGPAFRAYYHEACLPKETTR